MTDIDALVSEVTDEVIGWRRHLHQHPELSFEEVNTADYVFERLSSFGGLEITRPTRTSVMARLIGSSEGATLAIRADMDALPIDEETDFEFKSVSPGVMHACGHDAHTAILLGAAKVLAGLREHVRGEIRFFFQHAEELHPGGAVEMVRAGVMDGVDHVIGLHVRSLMESGRLCVSAGPINAASDRFDITIRGRGGHAAHPHTAVDSIAVAGQVIAALQSIVSRNTDPLDPLVLTITKIHGGTAYNVIPETVELGGTVRSYNPTLRDSVPGLMERIIGGITEAHGATFQLDYRRGYSPLINDQDLSERVSDVLKQAFGEEHVLPSTPGMGGEDFSGYLTEAPGTFFHLGAGDASKRLLYPHHHPKFWLDESAFQVGVKAFVTLALNL
ncbi:N-acyl-L-amino acid amidohydrolase [Alicyclobacillus ferrooxydans]|uniref:N-acyl-L-amino acid amidohydrolase n=1 Tax=Alicyclobacillus ferrooxydans TaxID=471514 RepID=A0A0P9CFA0_9BACL|nr:N-acyl-L-amino acid amidohydrolase [Alicyclobacillus ferrooxydans]